MRLSSALLAGGCGPAHLRPQREPRHPAPVRHIPRPAAMGPAPAMRPPPCSALARSSVPVQAKRGLWDCLALPGHPQRVETPGAHKLGSRGAALLTARPSPLRSRPPSPPASLTGSLSLPGRPARSPHRFGFPAAARRRLPHLRSQRPRSLWEHRSGSGAARSGVRTAPPRLAPSESSPPPTRAPAPEDARHSPASRSHFCLIISLPRAAGTARTAPPRPHRGGRPTSVTASPRRARSAAPGPALTFSTFSTVKSRPCGGGGASALRSMAAAAGAGRQRSPPSSVRPSVRPPAPPLRSAPPLRPAPPHRTPGAVVPAPRPAPPRDTHSSALRGRPGGPSLYCYGKRRLYKNRVYPPMFLFFLF